MRFNISDQPTHINSWVTLSKAFFIFDNIFYKARPVIIPLNIITGMIHGGMGYPWKETAFYLKMLSDKSISEENCSEILIRWDTL